MGVTDLLVVKERLDILVYQAPRASLEEGVWYSGGKAVLGGWIRFKNMDWPR
jgi:hypothetical protein